MCPPAPVNPRSDRCLAYENNPPWLHPSAPSSFLSFIALFRSIYRFALAIEVPPLYPAPIHGPLNAGLLYFVFALCTSGCRLSPRPSVGMRLFFCQKPAFICTLKRSFSILLVLGRTLSGIQFTILYIRLRVHDSGHKAGKISRTT